MNRRAFGLAMLGGAAAARSTFAQAPSWAPFKPQPGSLKEKMHTGQQIRSAPVTADATRSQLEAIIKERGQIDLFSLDGQHGAVPDERDLIKFCDFAEELGAGVQLRIPHPKWAHLSGRYADLGVLAVFVPTVEDEETANEAINNFYYPPLGSRSWGSPHRFKYVIKDPIDRLGYAKWWNENALLGFQIETLRAALNVRKIVKPGLDWIGWGANDMNFDIERHVNSPFKNAEEAHAFVIQQLKGYDVRVPGRAGAGG